MKQVDTEPVPYRNDNTIDDLGELESMVNSAPDYSKAAQKARISHMRKMLHIQKNGSERFFTPTRVKVGGAAIIAVTLYYGISSLVEDNNEVQALSNLVSQHVGIQNAGKANVKKINLDETEAPIGDFETAVTGTTVDYTLKLIGITAYNTALSREQTDKTTFNVNVAKATVELNLDTNKATINIPAGAVTAETHSVDGTRLSYNAKGNWFNLPTDQIMSEAKDFNLGTAGSASTTLTSLMESDADVTTVRNVGLTCSEKVRQVPGVDYQIWGNAENAILERLFDPNSKFYYKTAFPSLKNMNVDKVGKIFEGATLEKPANYTITPSAENVVTYNKFKENKNFSVAMKPIECGVDKFVKITNSDGVKTIGKANK